MGNQKEKPIEGEIVTPAQLDRILGKSEEPDIPALDAMLERFEQLFKKSLKVTDLDERENWFYELLGGENYRIAAKTERSQLVVGLVDVFMQNLDQFEQIEKKIRAINHQRHERYIDRVRAARTALEEQQKLEAVAANARLQRQLEEAKVEAEIEKYKRQVRDSQKPPQTASPSPKTPKVDESEVKRQAARKARKLDSDLKLDAVEAEMDYQDKLAATALARILKTFAEPQTCRAAKRSRILNLRDTYGIDDSLLPAGISELLEEEQTNH